MCFTNNKKRLVMLTDNVLLASAWDNNITKKEDREIKDVMRVYVLTLEVITGVCNLTQQGRLQKTTITTTITIKYRRLGLVLVLMLLRIDNYRFRSAI